MENMENIQKDLDFIVDEVKEDDSKCRYIWLKTVETTIGTNGYPEGLKRAIVGFEDFESAKKVAKEYNLEFIVLERKAGHQLYNRCGYADDPFFVRNMVGNDDSTFYDKDDLKGFFNDVMKPFIEETIDDFDSVEDFNNFSDKLTAIYDKLQEIEDDEFFEVRNFEIYETYKNYAMEVLVDSKQYIIGLM